MRKINKYSFLKYLEYLFILLTIIGTSLVVSFPSKATLVSLMALIGFEIFILILAKNKFDFEKTITIFFILGIPFFTDLDFVARPGDFHMAAKPYFRFNLMYVFAIIFMFFILKNYKKILQTKIKYDLILMGIFVAWCFLSMIWAVNIWATYYDAIRYLMVFIFYIYFSRICDYKKMSKTIMYSMIISLAIQLGIGLLQIIKNGPIGLSIFGESKQVFRAGVNGYEKGLSGTFGHPGPIALYSLIILSIIMFNKNIDKRIRNIGILIASLIIILAAGRTSIVLMGLVYLIFIVNNIKIRKVKETLKKIKKRNYFIGFSALVAVGFILKNQIMVVVNRFVGSDILLQLNSRSDFVEMAFHYIKQRPILGVGLNNYLDYTIVDFAEKFNVNFVVTNPIHNAYLLFAVEIGIIGSIIYILILLSNLYFFKLFRKLDVKTKYTEYKGILVSIIILIIYNLQGWGALHNRTLILFFVGLALLNNIYNVSNKKKYEYIES